MNKITLTALALLIVLVVSWFVFPVEPSGVASNKDDSAIRALVQAFGSKLKNVSLLANDASAQMQREYGAYVAPELLEKWQRGVESAPGRQTSSPWPERLDVVSVERQLTDTFLVKGNVIEVVSETGTTTEPAAVYPVTLTVTKRGGWTITKFEKGPSSELPHRQNLSGTWECLPHKDTSGPQTMECALGVALDGSAGHMAVDTSLAARYPIEYRVGTHVRIEGIVTLADQLSSNQWEKYDIKGIVRATMITNAE